MGIFSRKRKGTWPKIKLSKRKEKKEITKVKKLLDKIGRGGYNSLKHVVFLIMRNGGLPNVNSASHPNYRLFSMSPSRS